MRTFAVALILSILSCLSLFADPTPRAVPHMTWGPRTVFAGSSYWYEVGVRPAVDITCDPATDYCTSPQYTTPDSTRVVVLESTGRLPAGLWGFMGGSWPNYKPCQISGATFKLCRSNATDGTNGQAEDIIDTGTGTHTMYITNAWVTPGFNYGHSTALMNPAGTGFPAGVTFTWRTTNADGCDATIPTGTPPSMYDAITWCTKMYVPPTVAPGDYSGTFQWCVYDDQTNCSTYTLSFTVMAIPDLPRTPPTGTPPAIDGLAAWTTMLTETRFVDPLPNKGGGFFCPDPANGTTNPTLTLGTPPSYPDLTGSETLIWYYDGGKDFYRIADYLHDYKWANCGNSVVEFYRQWASTLSMQKHRQFPDGLAEGSTRVRADHKYDGRFKQALLKMVGGNTIFLYGPRVPPMFDRENAYALDNMVGLWKYWGYKHARYDDQLSVVIGNVMADTEPVNPYGYQTFMMGLQLHSLIYAYEFHPDPRIPYVVKRGVDHIRTHYNMTTHAPYYNTGAALGPWCAGVSSTWWSSDPGTGCQRDTNDQVLNNLFAHAFAWVWRWTGDDAYRVMGDDAFKYGTLWCCWVGKEFAQNYRLSFDYVRWRSLH